MLFQTALNIFGVTDILPLTGVTLPFISRGGSSLICSWGLLAFLKAADIRTYPKLSKTILPDQPLYPPDMQPSRLSPRSNRPANPSAAAQRRPAQQRPANARPTATQNQRVAPRQQTQLRQAPAQRQSTQLRQPAPQRQATQLRPSAPQRQSTQLRQTAPQRRPSQQRQTPSPQGRPTNSNRRTPR